MNNLKVQRFNEGHKPSIHIRFCNMHSLYRDLLFDMHFLFASGKNKGGLVN